MKPKTRTNTLDILERIDAADESLSATLSKREFRIVKELEASNLVEGQIGPDTHDAPDTIVEDVIFTTEGRLLMERLRKEEKERSFWSRTWRWLGPVIGYLMGIASPVAVAYLRNRFGL